MGLSDIHIHTIYSYDATTTMRGVLKHASSVGLDFIAVTDHDEIRGAFYARELASQYELEVVPGVEVSTRDGHLLALFIEKIPPHGLSLEETLNISAGWAASLWCRIRSINFPAASAWTR